VVKKHDHDTLRLLADGRWHSGEALAATFGVSRAAVWKRIKRLQNLPGIVVESASGKGYRLSHPLELLQRQRILEHVGEPVRQLLHELHLLVSTESTNSYLQQRCVPSLQGGAACLAEHQTAGRGRRGRQWISVFGRNLYLSLAWRFDLALQDLAGLSLVAGVALARVLREAGLKELQLKWPNDLLVEEKKLAGILVEASGEASGPCTAIIGVGVNLELDETSGRSIDQPWTDLRAHLEVMPGRNELAGALLDELVRCCIRYQQEGLTPFLESWCAWDGFLGQEVQLILGDNTLTGICSGLDARGGLILDSGGELRTFYAGEVILRKGCCG